MYWLLLAVFAYFLLAFESVANKFLLTGKIKSWQLYLFYIGSLSAFSFLFAPFGLSWPGWNIFLVSFLAGVVFFGYLGFLFATLECCAASRVFVLIGAVSTLTTLFLSNIFLGVEFSMAKLFGIAQLVIGGFFISFKFYKHRFFSGYKKAVLAGILLAVSLVILKYVYGEQNFVSGYVYSRIGIVTMTVFALFFPSFRKKVLGSFKRKKKSKTASQFVGVVAVKSLAGVATAILNFAISIGSVTIISALVSVQYLFVFIFSVAFGLFFGDVFGENMNRTNVMMKLLGAILVICGILFITI